MLVIARVILAGLLACVAVIGGLVALIRNGPLAAWFVLMIFALLGAMVAPDPE